MNLQYTYNYLHYERWKAVIKIADCIALHESES